MKYLALFLSAFPLAVQAAPITIGFSGSVDNDPYGNGWVTFSGQYTYDSAWADMSPSSDLGLYQGTGPIYGMNVNVDGGARSWSLYDWLMNVFIQNDLFVLGDEYSVATTDGTLNMEMVLDDYSHTVFDGDDLPTGAPILSDFDWPRFTLFDADAEFSGMVEDFYCVSGCVTDGGGNPGDNGNPNPVPEPGSMALLGLGLAAMTRIRKFH